MAERIDQILEQFPVLPEILKSFPEPLETDGEGPPDRALLVYGLGLR